MRIRQPRRTGAAVVIGIGGRDDETGLAFLEAYAAPLHEDDFFFLSLACGARYRNCWDAMYLGALGFRCRDGVGLTPASMRAGTLAALHGAGPEPGRSRSRNEALPPRPERRESKGTAAQSQK